MSDEPICNYCKEPIGQEGSIDFVTVAGSAFHNKCFKEVKSYL